ATSAGPASCNGARDVSVPDLFFGTGPRRSQHRRCTAAAPQTGPSYACQSRYCDVPSPKRRRSYRHASRPPETFMTLASPPPTYTYGRLVLWLVLALDRKSVV